MFYQLILNYDFRIELFSPIVKSTISNTNIAKLNVRLQYLTQTNIIKIWISVLILSRTLFI